MDNVVALPDREYLVIDYRARDWCLISYPNHPHGCPNYGHKATCPPQAPRIEEFINLEKRVWLAYEVFDLEAHEAKMLSMHPQWSKRQARCILYWQAQVNARLKKHCHNLLANLHCGVYTLCPEAMGVHVIRTARKLGIPVEPRPIRIVHKVALLGFGR